MSNQSYPHTHLIMLYYIEQPSYEKTFKRKI